MDQDRLQAEPREGKHEPREAQDAGLASLGYRLQSPGAPLEAILGFSSFLLLSPGSTSLSNYSRQHAERGQQFVGEVGRSNSALSDSLKVGCLHSLTKHLSLWGLWWQLLGVSLGLSRASFWTLLCCS